MQLLKSELADWTMITFQLESGETLKPEDLQSLVIPDVELSGGIVLDGRAPIPIWLHCYLLSRFSPARWVAVNDPKLKGAVVVRTHDPQYPIGSIQSTAFII